MLDKRLLENCPEDGSPSNEEDFSPSQVTAKERALVTKVLEAVEKRAKSLEAKGLTKRNFVFGVSNSLFVAWSFGAHPEYFWIIYLLEVAILFPVRWWHQIHAKPLKEHLFWLDFCWVANFSAVAFFIVLILHHDLSDAVRRWCFAACWGISTGPLLMAAGLLGNALIFHDFDNTASVLIHLFPSLLMFHMGWNHDRVHAAWPHIFKLNYFQELDLWNDIYCNAATAYSVWWLLYTIWLLSCGMKAPASGYDTIFHFNMRSASGKIVSKWQGRSEEELAQRISRNDFTRIDALIYMMVHAVMVCAAILVSLLCYSNKVIHIGLCGLMTFLTIYNAASRYTFYMLQSYGQVIRKELRIPFNRAGSALMSLPD